jgi:hypothetical protein
MLTINNPTATPPPRSCHLCQSVIEAERAGDREASAEVAVFRALPHDLLDTSAKPGSAA